MNYFKSSHLFFIAVFLAFIMMMHCAAPWAARGPLRVVSSDLLIAKIDANAKKLKTFKGFARLSVHTRDVSFQGALTISARIPDSLYAKVEGPFGIDLGLMQWHEDQFIFYSPFEQLAYTGSVDSVLATGMLPMPIDPGEFSHQVLGLIHVPDASRDSVIVTVTEDRHYQLIFPGGDLMLVHPDGPVISRWEKRDDTGRIIWEWEGSQFQKHHGMQLPRIVRVTTFEPKQQVTIFYRTLKTNMKLKPGWSNIHMPKDVLRLNL